MKYKIMMQILADLLKANNKVSSKRYNILSQLEQEAIEELLKIKKIQYEVEKEKTS